MELNERIHDNVDIECVCDTNWLPRERVTPHIERECMHACVRGREKT